MNLIFGGGRKNFILESEDGKRSDENLIEKWKTLKKAAGKSHQVLSNKDDLEQWDLTEYALGLFGKSHLKYHLDAEGSDQPSLQLMVTKAIQRLSKNENGFFLMVESGLIDKAHHSNLIKKSLEETLELEKAVKTALEMTDEDETLIVVTADHSHSMTINGYPKRGNDILGNISIFTV